MPHSALLPTSDRRLGRASSALLLARWVPLVRPWKEFVGRRARSFLGRAFFRVVLLGVLLTLRAAGAPPGGGWALAWSDEFAGTSVDTNNWTISNGTVRRDATNTANAVSVADGALTIKTYTEGGVHYTGWLGSNGKFEDAFGYWEARIRFHDEAGMWSAFWIQPAGINNVGDPAGNGTEIDVVEHRRRDNAGADLRNYAAINVHWDGYGADHQSVGATPANPGTTSLQDNWHTYAVLWTPERYRFYIDGVEVWTTTAAISQTRQWIYLTSEVESNAWSGPIPSAGYGTRTTSVTKMDVDYVRFYQHAETVVNGDLEARLAPWTLSNQASLASTKGRNGTQGVRVNPSTTAGSSIEQTVFGLVPNTDYILTGWADAAATTWAPIRIGVKNHGGNQTYQAIGSTGFTQATVPFTTGPTNEGATVFAWQPTQWGDVYVDDFILRRAASVNNPGLEADANERWTTYGGATTETTSNAHSGAAALSYPASTVASGAEQGVVGLTPNTTYRLTGWTKNGGQGLYFGAKSYGGSDLSLKVSSSAWSRGSITFKTGATNTSAVIYAWRPTSTADTYADDFFLCEPLTAPWNSGDVGSVGMSGIAGRRGEKFVLQAAGADIWGTADEFHFVYQTLTGDGSITARVRSLEETTPLAKAGVMMRESLAGNARHIALDWTPGGTLEMIRRSVAAGSSVADRVTLNSAPWVRLERRGNVFTGSYSSDGVTWVTVGSPQTIALPTTLYVGLPACAQKDTVFTEASLDNVEVINLPPEVTLTSPAAGALTLPGPGALRLSASASDDGAHGAMTSQWSVVSGPAGASFAKATALNTTVSLPVPGTYLLRLAVSNSAATGTLDLGVTVLPAVDSALVLWQKLNQTSGTATVDSSSSNLSGTLNGGGTWTTGVLNGALSLNGTDGFVNLGDSPVLDNTSALTLACWLRANSLAIGGGILSKRDGVSTNNSYSIILQTDGRINVDLDSNNNRFVSNTVLATNTWYHVALVFDGSQAAAQRAKLYINGELDVTASETSAALPNYPSPFRIGSTVNSGYFNGLLDDVRVYRRAMSAAEVAGIASLAVAPAVACGTAPAASNGVAASLSGSVVNELSGAATVAWTKVSGPGTVVFGNAASGSTNVTFNQAGTYVLRLTAINAVAEVFNDLTVNVAANPNIYGDWTSLHWPGVSNSSIIGLTADPERDGATNLLEWALGMDPTKADSWAATVGHAGMPVETRLSVGGLTYLALQVRRPIGRMGVTYSAIVSGDLSGWSAAVQEGLPAPTGDGTETFFLRDTVPMTSGSSPRFIRLKISTP